MEIELSEDAILDILSNTHNSDTNAVIDIIGGIEVIGRIRQFGNILIDRPSGYGRTALADSLDPFVDEMLAEGRWGWDDQFNGHQAEGELYRLDISRVVSPEFITEHPAELLELCDTIAGGEIKETVVDEEGTTHEVVWTHPTTLALDMKQPKRTKKPGTKKASSKAIVLPVKSPTIVGGQVPLATGD